VPFFTSGGLGVVSSGLALVTLVSVLRICSCLHHWLYMQYVFSELQIETWTTGKYTLWRYKSMPTQKAKLLCKTSHYGPTVVRSVTEIPFHVHIW